MRALLLTLWPDHIFQSQQTRFYIIAAFFAGLAMLLGGFVARRRSTFSAITVCCAIFAAILCHTLLAVLWGTIFAGIVAGSYAERRPFPKNVALVFLVAGILFALFGLFYLRPLASGWNSGENWGYTTLHSLLAAVNSVGWPVFLLAGLGVLLLLRDRSAKTGTGSHALGWGVASAVLPRLVVYHPGYAFPLASSVFVVAACAIGTIYDCLKTRGALIGAAWIGVACLSSLPGVLSHYKDGSRHDIRTAAEYVKKHALKDDRVAGDCMAWFAYYADGCPAEICFQCHLKDELEACERDNKRLWVVFQSCRGGLPDDREHFDPEHFLGDHFSHELTVQRTRFDYAEYRVDVFLFTPGAKGGLHGRQAPDSDRSPKDAAATWEKRLRPQGSLTMKSRRPIANRSGMKSRRSSTAATRTRRASCSRTYRWNSSPAGWANSRWSFSRIPSIRARQCAERSRRKTRANPRRGWRATRRPAQTWCRWRVRCCRLRSA